MSRKRLRVYFLCCDDGVFGFDAVACLCSFFLFFLGLRVYLFFLFGFLIIV